MQHKRDSRPPAVPATAPSVSEPTGAAASFWQRRIVRPLLDQFRRGATPEAMALTVALGTVISVFPILGVTTLICAAVAFRLKLNQPVMQLVNYLGYPLQFALLLPFYRAGEWLGAPAVSLSISELTARFEAGPMRFAADFALVALGGVAAWCLVAPFAGTALYYVLRPVLRSVAARTRGAAQA